MTKARTNWPALLLAGVAVLVLSGKAEATTTAPKPAAPANASARPAPPERYYPQHEAFQSAAEHAVYAGAYQQHFGPFGAMNPDREKNIRETAEAIEGCIKNRDCSGDKQEKILRALVQYNQGQAIKAVMLQNSTNAQRMITASPDSNEKSNVSGKTAQQVQDDRFKVVSQGLDLRDVRSGDSRAPASNDVDPEKTMGRGGLISRQTTGSSRASTIARQVGSARPDVLQMDESEIANQEILGERFVNDYRGFIRDYGATRPEHRNRYYQWVEANESYVLAGNRPTVNAQDEKKFNDAMKEQNLPQVQQAVEEYSRKIKAPYLATRNGQQGWATDTHPSALGIGIAEGASNAQLLQRGNELGKALDPNDPDARYRAVTRVLNKAFRDAGNKKDASNPPMGLANSEKKKDDVRKRVSMSPEAFDKYLDEIWPSSVKRAEIIARGIASSAPATATAPSPTPSPPTQTTAAANPNAPGATGGPSVGGGNGYNGGYRGNSNRRWPNRRYPQGSGGSGYTNGGSPASSGDDNSVNSGGSATD